MTVLAVGAAEHFDNHLYAYNWATGALLWNDDNETTLGTDAHVVIDPDGSSFVLDPDREHLLKFADDGTELWQVDAGDIGAQTPGRAISVTNDAVCIARRGDGDIRLFDKSDGSLLGNYSNTADPRCVQMDDEGWLAVGYNDGTVEKIEWDGTSFTNIWAVSIGSSPHRDVAVTAPGSAGSVWVTGDGTRVWRLASSDGEQEVSRNLGSGAGSRGYGVDVDDRGYIVVTKRSGETVAYDDADVERWSVTPNVDRGFGVAASPDHDWLVAWGNSIPEGGFTIARLSDTDGATVWSDDPVRMHGCAVMPGRLASFPDAWDDDDVAKGAGQVTAAGVLVGVGVAPDPANLQAQVQGADVLLTWDASVLA